MSSPLPPPDVKSIVDRAKAVLTDPNGCWTQIKTEQKTQQEILLGYYAPLTLVGAVCSLIGQTMIGFTMPILGDVKMPFFATLIGTIVMFVLGLAVPYLVSMILSKLAPNFGGSATDLDGFKLYVYATTAAAIGNFLTIVPALVMLTLLFSLYSLYTFYQGVGHMTTVPKEKQLVFTIVSIVVIAITMAIIFMTAGFFMPAVITA